MAETSAAHRLLDGVLLTMTALVTIAFASSLRDTPLYVLSHAPSRQGPAPPVAPSQRDARLSLDVVDETGALVLGAEARVISIVNGKAYVAATLTTGGGGSAHLESATLPRGEAWILVEADGRERASVRALLAPALTSLSIVLRRDKTLAFEVVDERDRPLPGAVIEIQGTDPLPFGAATDVYGRASMARLGPAPWSLMVSAVGYEAVHRATVPSTGTLQKIVLRKLGVLEVTVLDPQGAPAASAEIMVSGPSLWPARRTVTGEKGMARIAGLPAGSYEVVASTELTTSRSDSVPMTHGEDRQITVRLVEGRRITAKVVDAEGDDGSVVPGASVVLVEDGVSPFPREGRTDADGLVTLGPIVSGRATVSASAPGFVARSAMRVPEALDGPLVIALARGGTLRGDVRDTKGFPIEGASIEIIGTDLTGMPIDETPENAALRAMHFAFAFAGPRPLVPMGELGVTVGPVPGIPRPGEGFATFSRMEGGAANDPKEGVAAGAPGVSREGWTSRADGRFRASPVTPGRVRALVHHPSYVESVSQAVALGPGKEAEVHVVLSAGGALRGRVKTPSGQPVSGARIEVAAVHGSLSRSTLTTEDGSFFFAALPARITVSLARPEAIDRVVVRKAVTIGEDAREELELTLPGPREAVVVRVTDDRQTPLDNVQITAVSVSADSPFRLTQFTRADGVLQLPDAEGLALRLEVSLPGYATAVRTLAAAKREEGVALFRAVHVRGEVWARRGTGGLAHAEIALTTVSGTRRTRTDRDGYWLLRDLPKGPATLVVSHPKHAPLTRQVDLPEGDGSEPVSLPRAELEDGATVLGEVVDAEGHAVAGARVARDAVPAYVPTGTLPRGVVLTDGRGRFSLGELPLGEILLEAYAASVGRGSLRLEVREVDGRDLVRIVLADKIAETEPLAAGNVAITLAERRDGERVVFFVKLIVEGSEAERAGLRAGDTILLIERDAPATLEDARQRLAGPVGEDVLVVVRRDGREEKLRVLRERVTR